MNDTVYDVIIVGAGLAGLSAACTFLRSGVHKILLVEAQECIGGRVCQMKYGNLHIDLGAQWIHGQKNNDLYEFAAKHELVSTEESTEGEGLFYTQDGEVVDTFLVEEVNSVVSHVLFESILKDDDNVDAILTRAEVDFLRETNCSPGLVKSLFHWRRNYLLIDSSCQNLKDLSAKAWIEYEECQGPYCQTVKEGFMSIINQLANDVPKEIIMCNAPVSKIHWDVKENEGDLVRIQTCNGQRLVSRHCLVTCSVGVLQRCQLFEPKLPIKFRSALNGIGFGTITKIFLIFEKPFWDESCRGFQFAWKPSELAEGKNQWPKYMTGFDVVQSMEPAILIGWVGGDGAEVLDNSDVTDESVGEECVQLLKRFTNNPDIPKPMKTIRSKWMSNPYVLGAYSYRKTPFNTLLLNPITCTDSSGHEIPVLMFAGEAFDEDHHSTAHGAFESGRRQALKLIYWRQSFQQQSDKNT